VASVPSAITAAVAMYFVFSRSKPVRNVALRAPPVPTKPVINPDIPPPEITVHKLVGNFSAGLNKNEIEITIKNIPRMTLRMSCESIPTRKAPRKLSKMLGIPNVIIIFLSNPCLKKLILPRLPKRWNIATNTRAVLKSTKNNAMGKKMVEEPKPAAVPMISDINAEMKNNISCNIVIRIHLGRPNKLGKL
jgi:hypothetical protein